MHVSRESVLAAVPGHVASSRLCSLQNQVHVEFQGNRPNALPEEIHAGIAAEYTEVIPHCDITTDLAQLHARIDCMACPTSMEFVCHWCYD